MTFPKNAVLCALCEEKITSFSKDDEIHFCCRGCKAVYEVLSSKGELEKKGSHPMVMTAKTLGITSNKEAKIEAKNKSKDSASCCLEIVNLWCLSCCQVIELSLLSKKGVTFCRVDYSLDLAFIEYDKMVMGEQTLIETLSSLGYEARKLLDQQGREDHKDLHHRLIVSSICALNCMMLSYAYYSSFFSSYSDEMITFLKLTIFALSLPAVFYGGAPIFRRCLSSLSVAVWNMECLITIGALSGFCFSLFELLAFGSHIYFDAVSVVIALFLAGKALEKKAKVSTKESITLLARQMPKKARKKQSQGVEMTPLKLIHPGDLVYVFTSEIVPLDLQVIEGSCFVNNASLTGEVLPKEIHVGGEVLSGAQLLSGWILGRVMKEEKEGTFAKVLDLVSSCLQEKRETLPYLDRMLSKALPIYLLSSLVFFLLLLIMNVSPETAFFRLLSLLFISCPCAIGIAQPMAESFIMQGLMRKGALIRNRSVLSFLGKETTFFFDKTKTVTKGSFELLKKPSMPSIIKALAEKSSHPISYCLASSISEEGEAFDLIEEKPSLGMFGKKGSISYYLGSLKYLNEMGFHPKTSAINPLESAVYFATSEGFCEEIKLKDEIKEDARDLLSLLKGKKRILLSGDSEESVRYVAEVLGMEGYYSEKNPFEKQLIVKEAIDRGEIVTMLGDGVNDAPSLSQAHVGISVYRASNFSLQASDILLTKDDLSITFDICALGSLCQKIIRQNLFFAFFYNALFIPFAAFGYLNPIYSAFAMVASSLFVILNSRRMLPIIDRGEVGGVETQKVEKENEIIYQT